MIRRCSHLAATATASNSTYNLHLSEIYQKLIHLGAPAEQVRAALDFEFCKSIFIFYIAQQAYNLAMSSVREVRSDEEELANGLGSELLHSGNHMARTVKRWESAIPERLLASIGTQDESRSASAVFNRDGVHCSVATDNYVSPGQLYSTESGRMFHAGKILVVLVGMPATAKTLLSVAITRYTRWLGVRTSSFHISEYTRDLGGLPLDYLIASPDTPQGQEFKHKLIEKVADDMIKFFRDTMGQLAIYDALNIRKQDRAYLNETFSEVGVKVVFIESIVTNKNMLNRNIDMAIQSSEYHGLSKEDATTNFMKRYFINERLYETMSADEPLSFVKYFNFGEKITVHNNMHGYLINKIVFFLMNLKKKEGCVYFARCGTSDKDKYLDDEELNDEGVRYSKVLAETVIQRIEQRHQNEQEEMEGYPKQCQREAPKSDASLSIWTAPRKRTFDTGKPFEERGFHVIQRSELRQLHPGSVADLTVEEIKEKFPTEYKEYEKDPYHFRFPRAESYHDLAVRMEPMLMEMEHTSREILIIAHESTLKVLYGYFMACTSVEVPLLAFPRTELVEIKFAPFSNTVKRIPINYL